jgi:23S rRNA (adenine2503-C2)-methyltransferase
VVQAESKAAECESALRDIRECTLTELEQIVSDSGERPYRARQVMSSLWASHAKSFDEMRQVPAALRDFLKQSFRIEPLTVRFLARSDDDTRKLLLALSDNRQIESVIIPTEGRTTLCVSSQAGCGMGCAFCATARMGLHRNLTAGEILGQIVAAEGALHEGERITNYVFMGMGEPLANYPRLSRALTIMTADWGLGISPRRITVSTVGVLATLPRLLADFQVNLAVSIHATTDELRDRLAPINRRYPLRQLIDTCERLPIGRRRRITFEYVMLENVNDRADDARRLVKMLATLRAKVNLIMFNPFPGAPFKPSPRRRVEDFQAILHRGNLTATIRESRGQDIAAACGQLYAERRQVA